MTIQGRYLHRGNSVSNSKITIETEINSDIDTVWEAWNSPEDIKKWNAASEDWQTTESSVELKEGGAFSSRMEAKDGSMGFDFSGIYTKIIPNKLIEYTMDDGRTVSVKFECLDNSVKVTETFEAETTYDIDHQREGWQSILNNFAKHVVSK